MATIEQLRNLKQDWDSYGGPPIAEEAIKTAENLTFVPLSSGGIQIEMHAGGVDLEIEITSEGRVRGGLWELVDAPQRKESP